MVNIDKKIKKAKQIIKQASKKWLAINIAFVVANLFSATKPIKNISIS